MNEYVEAPEVLQPDGKPVVFLAGGITGCPDWQSYAAFVLLESPSPVVVCNPRRVNFPIEDPDASKGQIDWEYRHLHLPNTLTMMWFPECNPKVTTQPIAMYEMGAAAEGGRPLLVGADEKYPRARDVKFQLALARPEISVVSKLDELLNLTLSWVANH